MLRIGLIGYGYWGHRVSNILIRKGYELDTVYTSKSEPDIQTKCHAVSPISDISYKKMINFFASFHHNWPTLSSPNSQKS